MKAKYLISLLLLCFLYEMQGQEKTIWKEMTKEYDDCGSSLKLYSNNTFFYEEFCEGTRFNFCLGTWEEKQNFIRLNPKNKSDFTFEIIEKKEHNSFSGIIILDENNKPISNFDFIQFPNNIAPEEALSDMDDYISFTGKPGLTEVSYSIHTSDDGSLPIDNLDDNQKLLAYDLYQISDKKVVFSASDIINTSYTLRINFPGEIFQYEDLNYIELPSNLIELSDENFEFINKKTSPK